MATLALGFAGAAIAGGMATSATAVVFAGMTAAGLGMAIGSTIGGVLDSMYVMPTLFGGAAAQTGPRLNDLNIQNASEGSAINRCFGPECRCAGTVIWSPRLTEQRITENSGGKHGGSTTYYRYMGNIAVLACRNEISRVRKIWADSKLIWDSGDNVGNATIVTSTQISCDVVGTKVYFRSPSGGPNLNSAYGRGRPFQTSGFANAGNNRTDWHAIRSSENSDGSTFVECTFIAGAVDEAAGATVTLRQEGDEEDAAYESITVYTGTTSQNPDPLMESVEGAGNVPAFRGSSYIVVEGWNCRESGNRLPQFQFLIEEATTRTLASVIADVLEMFGLTSSDYDVSAVTGNVQGYVLAGPTNGAKALEPLMLAYNIGVQESNGKLRFFMRATPSTIEVASTELAAHEELNDYERPALIQSISSQKLAAEVVVNFIEPELDWQKASQSHRRQVYVVDSTASVDVPLVMTAGEAQALAQRLLYTSWGERRRLSGSIPASFIHVEEGDHLEVPFGERLFTVRVDQLTRGHNFRVEFSGTILQSQTNTTFEQADDPSLDASTIYVPPDCVAVFLDLPPVADAQVNSAGFYYGTFALDPNASFIGASFKLSTDAINYTALTDLPSELTGGYAETALANGSSAVWDLTNTVDVEVRSGTLASATEAQVLAGTNWAALGNEIIAFQTATSLGDGRYRLSRLLRGLRNTEDAMSTHAVQDLFVMLSGLQFSSQSYASLGLRYAKAVAMSGVEADAEAASRTLTGRTVKPFAPCHVRAVRNSSNDATITWVRRGRGITRMFSGAVPTLHEEDERYSIEIRTLADALVRTTEVVGATTLSYTAAQQTSDGITPGNSFKVRAYQVSTAYGRGTYKEETV